MIKSAKAPSHERFNRATASRCATLRGAASSAKRRRVQRLQERAAGADESLSCLMDHVPRAGTASRCATRRERVHVAERRRAYRLWEDRVI